MLSRTVIDSRKIALTLAVMAQVEVGALDAYEQSPNFLSYNTLE
jgi:hypothetical protein